MYAKNYSYQSSIWKHFPPQCFLPYTQMPVWIIDAFFTIDELFIRLQYISYFINGRFCFRYFDDSKDKKILIYLYFWKNYCQTKILVPLPYMKKWSIDFFWGFYLSCVCFLMLFNNECVLYLGVFGVWGVFKSPDLSIIFCYLFFSPVFFNLKFQYLKNKIFPFQIFDFWFTRSTFSHLWCIDISFKLCYLCKMYSSFNHSIVQIWKFLSEWSAIQTSLRDFFSEQKTLDLNDAV